VSTYYYFHCTKHQSSGGCFTRQAWGAGNAELIDSFKFVMHHVLECGPESIGMHSEHYDDDWSNTNVDGDARRQHLEDTAHIFPRSNDWEFVNHGPKGTDLNAEWIAAQLATLEE
jgi:hypothetical protein